MSEALVKLKTLTKEQVANSGIQKVYMDADGCLVDWEGYVGKRLHHFLPDTFSVEDYRSNIGVLNGLNKEVRENLIKRYYRTYPDTFLDLDILPSFHYLVSIMTHLRSLGLEVSILTSLDDKHHDLSVAEFQKRFNLNTHLSHVSVNFPILVTKNHGGKLDYANGNALLIDDYHKNVSQFIEGGGSGILFKDTESCISKLYEHLSTKFI